MNFEKSQQKKIHCYFSQYDQAEEKANIWTYLSQLKPNGYEEGQNSNNLKNKNVNIRTNVDLDRMKQKYLKRKSNQLTKSDLDNPDLLFLNSTPDEYIQNKQKQQEKSKIQENSMDSSQNYIGISNQNVKNIQISNDQKTNFLGNVKQVRSISLPQEDSIVLGGNSIESSINNNDSFCYSYMILNETKKNNKFNQKKNNFTETSSKMGISQESLTDDIELNEQASLIRKMNFEKSRKMREILELPRFTSFSEKVRNNLNTYEKNEVENEKSHSTAIYYLDQLRKLGLTRYNYFTNVKQDEIPSKNDKKINDAVNQIYVNQYLKERRSNSHQPDDMDLKKQMKNIQKKKITQDGKAIKLKSLQKSKNEYYYNQRKDYQNKKLHFNTPRLQQQEQQDLSYEILHQQQQRALSARNSGQKPLNKTQMNIWQNNEEGERKWDLNCSRTKLSKQFLTKGVDFKKQNYYTMRKRELNKIFGDFKDAKLIQQQQKLNQTKSKLAKLQGL